MSDYSSTVKLLIDYIEENLQSDLSMDTIAKKFNYSAFFIQRVFSAVTHKSIHDYITERRLIKAGEEILNGGKIIDAALSFGYGSHNGFTKAFEKKFGLPPSRVSECINIIMDKPLRIMERDFYNRNGSLCICHEIMNLEEFMLEGDIYTVNLKDFWNNDKLKQYIKEKVSSFIKYNENKFTYCIGIPYGSEVQYFVGKKADEYQDADSLRQRMFLAKSTYIKFSYRGDLKDNPDTVIYDTLKCFSTCNIIPDQEKIDHIEVFTRDYLETEVFDILVPIKQSMIV